MEQSLGWNNSGLPLHQWPDFIYLSFSVNKSLPSNSPFQLEIKKAKEDFTLNLIKHWRGTLLTNSNASKFFERLTLWNELLLFAESRPKTKFSQEEINKKRVIQMVADGRLSAACASLISDALSETNEENLAKLLEKHPPQDIPEDAPSPNGLEQLKVSPQVLQPHTSCMRFKSIIKHWPWTFSHISSTF